MCGMRWKTNVPRNRSASCDPKQVTRGGACARFVVVQCSKTTHYYTQRAPILFHRAHMVTHIHTTQTARAPYFTSDYYVHTVSKRMAHRVLRLYMFSLFHTYYVVYSL